MPAIEFTYCDDDGMDYEVYATYDPPDRETGITDPRIDTVSVTADGLPVTMPDDVLDLILQFAYDRLQARPE